MEDLASQIIPDLETTRLVDEAQAYLDKRLKFNPDKKPQANYRGADVYQFGDGSSTSYVFLAEGAGREVTYFVKYQRIRYSGFVLGRQVMVVRKRQTSATEGFARHVFFNFLLKRYGALIADKQQTRFGKNFWTNAIGVALELNKYVYFLDRRPSPNTLTRIESETHLFDLEPSIWGTDKRHQLTYAIISDRPLLLRPKTRKTI